MVQVTGSLEVKNGYIRVKPNVPFIGSLSGVSAYEISDGLINLHLAPTPNDRVYLVDYSLSLDAAFLPTENWIVPEYDCELNEVRGLVVYKQNLQLHLDNNQLQLKIQSLELNNNQLRLDNNQLQSKIQSLELDNNQLRLDNNQLQSKIQSLELDNNQLRLDNNQLQLQTEELTLSNNQLHLDNNQLRLDNNQLQSKIQSLELENSNLNLQTERLALHKLNPDEKNFNLSSINILNRFL
jgi:hypothetical protein